MPCLGQLWYLSNEMMFFVLVPFIVLAYINKRFIGYAITSFLIFACFVTTFVFSHIRGHSITIIDDPAAEWNKEFYNLPITRFGAYFMGVLFGIMYFEWMRSRKDPTFKLTFGAMFYNSIKNNGVLRYGIFLFSSVWMVLFIIAPRLETHELKVRKIPQIPSDIFNMISRPFFVAAMGLFLSGPMVGRMSFIRGLFGGKLWAPWAKVTFTAYLFHVCVICWAFLQTKGATYMTGTNALFYSFAIFLITVILSVPITLIIESPILQLEKLVLFPPKPKPVAEKNEIETNLLKNNLNVTDSEADTSMKSDFKHKS